MGSSPSAPPAPDPKATADQQIKINRDAQEGSLINQSTPYGSLSYTSTIDPVTGTPVYTANTKLSDAQQNLLNQLQTTQATAGKAGSDLLNSAISQYSQAPNLLPGQTADQTAAQGGLTNNISNSTQSLTDKLLGQYTSSLQPQFDYQKSTLDTQLRNQGLNPGDPAYVMQMKNLQSNQNQNLEGFLANVEPQAYSQAVNQYELPLQTAQQLSGFGAPTSLASNLVNTSAGQIQPANYGNIVNQSGQLAQQAYGNQAASYNNMLTGGANLAGNLLKMPSTGTVGSSIFGGLSSLGSGIGTAATDAASGIGSLFGGIGEGAAAALAFL